MQLRNFQSIWKSVPVSAPSLFPGPLRRRNSAHTRPSFGEGKRQRETHPILIPLQHELHRLPELAPSLHRIQFVQRPTAQLAHPSLDLAREDIRRVRRHVGDGEFFGPEAFARRKAEEVLEQDEDLDEDLSAETRVRELQLRARVEG